MLSTALGAGFICILSLEPRIARADCTPTTTPTTGETVTCTDTSTTAVSAQAGATDVTVNLMDGAVLNVTGSSAVTVRGSSAINLYGSASVIISTVSGLRTLGSYGSTITLNDTSSVTSTGSGSGISLLGGDHTLILNDSSYVLTSDAAADGIVISGTAGGNLVTVGGDAWVTTTGSGANAVSFSSSSGSNTLINYGTLTSNGITVYAASTSNIDIVQNYGDIISTTGTAISLNDGDDLLTLGTGSNISGSIDGGDGTDSVTLVGSGTEDDDFLNFETLTMNGTDWTLSGASSFNDLYFNSGDFTNSGSLFVTNGVTIGAGAGALTNNGYLGSGAVAITGSSGDDTVENYGGISGGAGTAISLNDGNDALTLGTGSSIVGDIDGGGGIDDVTLVGSGSEDDDLPRSAAR